MKIFSDILADLKPKHLAVGAVVLFVTAWGFSRLLPGAAARMGLRPRPLFPDYQNDWPEPFGLTPILPNFMAPAQPSDTSTSGLTQEQLGRAIVSAAQGGAAGDILQNITSGNA